MEHEYSFRSDRREAITQLLVHKLKVFADAWTPEKVSPKKLMKKRSRTGSVRTNIPQDIGGEIVRENFRFPKSSEVIWEPSRTPVKNFKIREVLPKIRIGGFLEHKANLNYKMNNSHMLDSGLERTVKLGRSSRRRSSPRKPPELSKKNLAYLGQLPSARDSSADPNNLSRLGKSLHSRLKVWYREDREELNKLQVLDRSIFR